MLERSRLAEDLLKTVGQLFGSVRGGIGFAVIIVGALLAAATGVVGASVVAMATISLPVMLRYNYNKQLATGLITASGTLGQIIPPSVVLIVLADQIHSSTSVAGQTTANVGDLFRGALVPGLMLVGLFMLYLAVVSIVRKDHVPPIPKEERDISGKQLAIRTVSVLVPPLLLILIVLGSIVWGIATPSEAGAMGSLGAMILAFANKRFTKEALIDTMRSTMKLTAMVMFLLIGSTAFVLVFKFYGADSWIQDLLHNLPGGILGALIIANLVIFLLGFFIDFFEISFSVVPLIAPVFVGQQLGDFTITPVWFGVMIAMNLQMSFLTPPFGFSLFYLKGVAPPEIKTTDIYRGVIPFIVIQAVALILVIAFPQISW